MADESKGAPKPSWRNRPAGPAASEPAQASAPSSYEWTKRRRGATESGRATGSVWALRVAAALTTFLLCGALVVYLVSLIQPSPPAVLVLVGADHATNLSVPHNVPGVNGLQALEALSQHSRKTSLLAIPPVRTLRKRVPLDRASDWDVLIDGLSKDRSVKPKQAIVVVVALHGESDATDGFLLPDQTSGPHDRIKLRHVIESMARLPEPNAKLLVLEPTQLTASWSRGMIHNDFVRRLRELGPEIARVPNLWVLCSSDVDQTSWVSEGLGTSPFLHFLAEGLRGKAAGSDGKVALDELAAYVRQNVAGWVWRARETIQEPILLPGSEAGRSAGGRRLAPRDVFLAGVSDSRAAAVASEPARAGLERAWLSLRELDQLVPHPATYSPQKWREYREAVVRYEELVRWGANESAGQMADRIAVLDRQLRNERILRLPSSAENSLALNAVQGGRIGDPGPSEALTRFWTAADADECNRAWQALSGAAAAGDPGDDRRASLLTGVAGFLVDRAIEEPGRGLAAAAQRLRLARSGDRPEPTEAHFVRMLDRYLPRAARSPRDEASLAHAVSLHRRAAATAVGAVVTAGQHAYSEATHAWIRDLVQGADTARRQAEDLLFASDPESHQEVDRLLGRAEQLYRQADLEATRIRIALALRDRALADLPNYARWVPSSAGTTGGDRGELGKLLETLAASAHELDRLLRDPAQSDPGRIEQVARSLEGGLGEVSARFAAQREEIDQARQGKDWEAATTAARVPFSDSADLALRKTLWDRLDNIRRKDREITIAPPAEGALANQRERLRERARLEGRMALAVLGAEWFNSSAFRDLHDSATVDRALRQDTAADDASAATLDELGTQIGLRWQEIPDRIARILAEGNEPSQATPDESALPLAAGLSRIAVEPGRPTEPANLLRRRRTHDLLEWLANRTWLDHWYDESPEAPPYFQVAGRGFLQDAQQLRPVCLSCEALKKMLDAPGKLALDGPESLVITSEPNIAAPVRCRQAGDVPPGIPVVRALPEPLLALDRAALQNRRLDRPAAGRDLPPVVFHLGSPLVAQAEAAAGVLTPRLETASLQTEGFFRGQLFGRKTPVTIEPVPSLVLSSPDPLRPRLASIAVRAEQDVIDRYGQGAGAVAIVLDCSGSMVNPVRSKFDEAKTALLTVLRTLPAGTELSILTFGQAATGFVREFPRPEDTQQHDRPELTIQVLRPLAPWDPGEIADLQRQLDALQPFYGTPLVEAMWRGKLELDKAKGLKTLLVLTDGKDTRLLANRAFNPKGLDIPTFLGTYFRNTGILVDMVFFKVVEDELKEATEQFAAAVEHLDLPGRFVTVQSLEKLITTLQSAIVRKLVCRLEDSHGGPVGELDVAGPSEADRWWTRGLPAGDYTLRLVANRIISQAIHLEDGDRLVVRVALRDDRTPGFERVVYGEEARQPAEPLGEASGWQLSVLASQLRGGAPKAGLDLLLTLEELPQSSRSGELLPLPALAGALTVEKPSFTWFGLVPGSAQGATQLRWRERKTYPGPVWSLSAPQWVTNPGDAAPARPLLNAWWLAGARPAGVKAPTADQSQVRTDDGTPLTIESVRVEDHLVQESASGPPRRVSCLVVRVAYPSGKPCLVDPGQIEGVPIERFEHRWYPGAGKYEGLFWPVSRGQIEQDLKGLGLVAIEPLLRQAEAEHTHVELKLAVPRTQDRLPDPPQAILKR